MDNPSKLVIYFGYIYSLLIGIELFSDFRSNGRSS